MARMAKSDADLFRTIGEQNASVRQMVDHLVPAVEDPAAHESNPSLAPVELLPLDQCDQKALKARFGKVVEAQAWIEDQVGKAPKKPTWLVIEQTCRSGAWLVAPKKAATAAKRISPEQLDERLSALEAKLMQRFDRLERALLLVADAANQKSIPPA